MLYIPQEILIGPSIYFINNRTSFRIWQGKAENQTENLICSHCLL